MKYSTSFRNGVLRKVLPPQNRTVYQVARESGVSAITIHSWLSKVKEGTLEIEPEGSEPTPGQRSVSEKFRLLMEGKQIPEEQRGEFLRQNGLHAEHLSLWEQELSTFMTDKNDDVRSENAELKKKNKALEKELLRKERALAEVVALLTLKKKYEDKYGVDEED